MKAPTSAELTQLTHRIAHRVGHFLERQGLLERTVENSYLATDADNEDPMNILLGHAITYRIAVGPQTGRKVFTLQAVPGELLIRLQRATDIAHGNKISTGVG